MIARLLAIPTLPIGGGDEMAAPTMPTPEQQLDNLHEQITEALAEVRGARAAHQHCPSQDNASVVEYAEFRLGRLLDRLPREKTA